MTLSLASLLAIGGCGTSEEADGTNDDAGQVTFADGALAPEAGGSAGPDGGAVDGGPPVDAGESLDGEVPDTSTPPDAVALEAGLEAGQDAAASPPPDPTPRDPCMRGACWQNAAAIGGRCGASTVGENFETGRYNVHQFPLTARAGVAVTVTLERTAGAVGPALILHDAQGATLYDGERGAPGPVEVEGIASGRREARARLRLTAPADTVLLLFVTSWEVIDGDFEPPMPQDVDYTLTLDVDCPVGPAVCPVDPAAITRFGSGYYTEDESSDPNAPNYSPYKRDERPSHSGYDIHAPFGAAVYATQNGVIVSLSSVDAGDCGLSINLAVGDVTFRYCHLSEVLVAEGLVMVGQLVGRVGATGNANAAHVHFIYLDAPGVVGIGAVDQRSRLVNEYVDSLCR